MAKAEKRMYKVLLQGNATLVMAATQAQAIRHVVKSQVEIATVSAIEALALVKTGCAVEEAGKEADHGNSNSAD